MKKRVSAIVTLLLLPQLNAQESEELLSAEIERIEVTGKQLGYYERNASTAMRQNISLLETPQSVFVINETLIKDQQSFRIDQVLLNDASVQKSNNFLGAYSSFQIRGFALSNASNYLRNGRPFFHLASPPVEVLDRIEVAKGPSSVLYGTMAPGGVINMSSKRASGTDLKGMVKATLGSDDFKHVHVDVGSALNEDGTLRGRVNLVKENSNSHRRFFDGSDFEIDRQIVSLNLEYDISNNTIIRFDYDDTNDDRPQDAGLFASPPNGLPASDPEIIITQPWSLYNSDVTNIALEVEHFFNNKWSIKAGIFAQDYERERYDQQYRGFDPDTGDVVVRTRRRINGSDYQNAYVDVSGQFMTGEFEHQILVGAETTVIDLNNLETSRNENYVTNIFNPISVDDPLIPLSEIPNIGETVRNGLFMQDVIKINDQVRVIAGLRYDDFETFFERADGTRTSDYEVSNTTPRLGVVFLPTSNQSWYVSFNQSFEPNSPVAGRFDNAGEELEPTYGDMYEVGYKWENQAGDLLFGAALFDIERRNQPFETDDNRIEQRGTQRHKGAEASLTGLIGNLSLTGSLSMLDAKFTEDDDLALIGNTPTGVAELTAAMWLEYQLETLNGLSLQAGWRYEGDRPMDNANTFEHEAYHKVDIGVKYEHFISEKTPLIYRLTVSNLFDESYFKSGGLVDLNLEAPRLIRAAVEYAF